MLKTAINFCQSFWCKFTVHMKFLYTSITWAISVYSQISWVKIYQLNKLVILRIDTFLWSILEELELRSFLFEYILSFQWQSSQWIWQSGWFCFFSLWISYKLISHCSNCSFSNRLSHFLLTAKMKRKAPSLPSLYHSSSPLLTLLAPWLLQLIFSSYW